MSVFIDMSMCIVVCPWQVKSPSVHLKGGSLSLYMQTSYLCTLMLCSCCCRSQQSDSFFLSKQFPIIISALTHKSTNFLSRCLFYISHWLTFFLYLSKHILFREQPQVQGQVTDLLLNLSKPCLCRLRSDLNATLEAGKKKDAPVKKISLNDFVIKVIFLSAHNILQSTWGGVGLFDEHFLIIQFFQCAGCSLGIKEGARG